MIRFVAGLLMVFVGIGTMEQDEVAVVVSNYSAGLWLCIGWSRSAGEATQAQLIGVQALARSKSKRFFCLTG